MDEREALHTAARHFCIDQTKLWVERYTQLDARGVAREGDDYSTAAYSTFPRYRFYGRLLPLIEGIAPQQHSQSSLLVDLEAATKRASTELGRELKNVTAVAAIEEEAREIIRYIREFDTTAAFAVVPLPRRRTLASAESESLWSLLQNFWNVRRGSPWHPLLDEPVPASVLTFHQELWDAREGEALLLRSLEARGITDCFVLHEFDIDRPDYVAELAALDPYYNGAEKFTTSDASWLLYASHESSIAIAGWVAGVFLGEWPDAKAVAYGGPFHTDDLRGTWET